MDAALAKVNNLIVADHQRTAIMDKANLILSSASFAESDGTLINQKAARSASSVHTIRPTTTTPRRISSP